MDKEQSRAFVFEVHGSGHMFSCQTYSWIVKAIVEHLFINEKIALRVGQSEQFSLSGIHFIAI